VKKRPETIELKIVPIGNSKGVRLPKSRKAEIAVDQIRTISKSRLTQRIDNLTPANAASVRRLIVEMFGE
jgi:mRNA-degrading endonuclease toxin of MazEF toxin-antitoxin module